MTVTDRETAWVGVCGVADLCDDRGVAVLVGGQSVALFRLAATATSPVALHAVDHVDPATGVPVIARGLVGSAGDRAYVASPLHKQRYDLASGECLDDPDLALRCWPVRVNGDRVEVGTIRSGAAAGGPGG